MEIYGKMPTAEELAMLLIRLYEDQYNVEATDIHIEVLPGKKHVAPVQPDKPTDNYVPDA